MSIASMTQQRQVLITEHDQQRLRELIESSVKTPELLALRAELDRAEIVRPEEIPADVVTMNSTVRFTDLDLSEPETYTLVFPDQADVSQNRLSVLSPLGTALLGYRVGDVVSLPRGGTVVIDEVLYQPERAGEFNL